MARSLPVPRPGARSPFVIAAAALAVALVGAPAGTGAAVASAGEPEATDDAAADPVATTGEPSADSREPGEQEVDERTGDRADERTGDRADERTGDRACELLVAHDPDGTSGEAEAVAITSQVLREDRSGWEAVGWEAAEHAVVEAVEVVRADGSAWLEDGDLRTGHVEDVLELRFCGHLVGADDGAAPGDGDAPGEEDDVPGEEDDVPGEDGAGDEDVPGEDGSAGEDDADRDEGDGPDDDPGSGAEPDTDADAGERPEGDEQDTADDAGQQPDRHQSGGVEEDRATEGDGGQPDEASSAGAPGDEGEVEVLGVQLTADELPRTGDALAVVAGLAGLAVALGAALLAATRRWGEAA